jgi:hypothetical protein
MLNRFWPLSGFLLLTAVVSQAANPNVALNKPVTLNGNFPVFTYPGGLCGVNPPQPSPSIVTNGTFLPEETCFQSGVYWTSVPPNANPNNTVDIDLQGIFLISSATVQADDNDIYTLQYRDLGGVYHDWYPIPPAGAFGLTTRPNPTDPTQQQPLPPVLATGLRFFAPAGSGDGYYAVSQIAVFGVAVAPPTITKAFADSELQLLGPSNTTALSFTITNPNAAVTLPDIAFTDTLPGGLIVSTPNGLTGSCGGGTITAGAGSSSISLSGATLAGGASCTFSVNVTATAIGVQTNTTSTVTALGGALVGSPATATTAVDDLFFNWFLAGSGGGGKR